MRQIQIIGDSHAHALKRALSLAKPDDEVSIVAERYIRMKDDKPIGDVEMSAVLKRIEAFAAEDLVVSAIGGNMHSVFGLVQHPQPFDFHSPRRPDLAPLPGREILPYRLLHDFFASGMSENDGEQIRELRAHTRARVAHLCPPPPKADEELIMRRHETHFLQQGLLDRGVTPASIRLKLWDLQAAVLAELCPTWNVEFVPPPAAAQTALGYLDPAYYANDATHANHVYGRLVLAQLRSMVLKPMSREKART